MATLILLLSNISFLKVLLWMIHAHGEKFILQCLTNTKRYTYAFPFSFYSFIKISNWMQYAFLHLSISLFFFIYISIYLFSFYYFRRHATILGPSKIMWNKLVARNMRSGYWARRFLGAERLFADFFVRLSFVRTSDRCRQIP